MAWFDFVLMALAAFRLTRLFVYDRITEFIRKPFHEIREETESDGAVIEVLYIKGTGVRKFIGELLSCHWCTGVWCALLLYIGHTFWAAVFQPIVYILALAAVASLIEEFIDK
ncbi:MAG: DUF1360 domain-containing protein [Tuberibacillus sp.]